MPEQAIDEEAEQHPLQLSLPLIMLDNQLAHTDGTFQDWLEAEVTDKSTVVWFDNLSKLFDYCAEVAGRNQLAWPFMNANHLIERFERQADFVQIDVEPDDRDDGYKLYIDRDKLYDLKPTTSQ